MNADWIPIRWPAAWSEASALELLQGTPFNCLIMEPGPLAGQAVQAGYEVLRPGKVPAGITILEGVWPGIRMSRFGAHDVASAGPTGEPWVDSNVWPVRLALARDPQTAVWIKTAPRDNTVLSAPPLITAMADASLAGGRWIVTLPDSLAARLAEKNPAALMAWQQVARAAAYFEAKKAWQDYQPAAVPGILSDFTTPRSRELLNLTTRTGQQYRILLKEHLSRESLSGLKAVVWADAEAPPPPLRSLLTDFVTAGGLLIAGPEWGPVAGSGRQDATHPRYIISTLGSGSVALAKEPFSNSYLLANDMAILISHRHDLLRFWNGGPLSARYSTTADRRRAVVQVLFYARRSADAGTSVRIAGSFANVQCSSPEQPDPQPLPAVHTQDALEVNLPGAAGYLALELEA